MDPGLFRLWVIVRDLTRLIGKEPRLLELVARFHTGFRGSLLPGPSLSFLRNSIRLAGLYSIRPEFRITTTCSSRKSLWARILDGWHQFLATQLQHRPDYNGLIGLNWQLTSKLHYDLAPTARGRVASLQEGAFITGQQHCRFDLSQSGDCPWCQVPGTLEHRCLDCPTLASARLNHGSTCRLWHLLVCRITC